VTANDIEYPFIPEKGEDLNLKLCTSATQILAKEGSRIIFQWRVDGRAGRG